MVNKEEIVLEWVRSCPLVGRILLNFLGDDSGSSAVIPIDEAVAAEYICGDKLINYDFMFQALFTVSGTTDNINTDTIFTLRQWQDWIEEQNENGNLPDFGDGYDMQEIQNLSQMPTLALIHGNGTGKYQFPARLVYLKQK